MIKYISKRVVQIVILLFIYVTIVYWLLEAMPGSFIDQYIMNPKITPEAREALKKLFGYDKPAWERYLIYMKNFIKGDLGTSFAYYPKKVVDIIKERLPRTVFLFVTATLISYTVGFNLGKRIAWRRGKVIDKVATFVGIIFWTIFTPILAIFNIWLFAVILKILPLNQFINPALWRDAPFSSQEIFYKLLWSGFFIILGFAVAIVLSSSRKTIVAKKLSFWGILLGVIVAVLVWWSTAEYVDPTTGNVYKLGKFGGDIVAHMVLPILTLTMLSFAGSMLVMRDTMLEIIREDYITTAKAKGLPDHVVRDKHAARNALLPLVTNFVISLGFTVSGGIITETMFSWPGMGLAYLEALNSQDIPLLVGLLVFTGIFVLFAHLIADILYAFLDPRIRY